LPDALNGWKLPNPDIPKITLRASDKSTNVFFLRSCRIKHGRDNYLRQLFILRTANPFFYLSR
jgi:hypothetical protein